MFKLRTTHLAFWVSYWVSTYGDSLVQSTFFPLSLSLSLSLSLWQLCGSLANLNQLGHGDRGLRWIWVRRGGGGRRQHGRWGRWPPHPYDLAMYILSRAPSKCRTWVWQPIWARSWWLLWAWVHLLHTPDVWGQGQWRPSFIELFTITILRVASPE
jgi:hypothetical protein